MSGARVERVADRLRDELARLLREQVRDPRIGFVTLTSIKLSSDLRHANVFVTTIDDSNRESLIEALNHAVPFLRRHVARHSGLRYTPEIRFHYDEAFESGLRVDSILDSLDLPEIDPEDET